MVCLLAREINYSNRPVDKTSRWIIRGSRLFNPIFGLPRAGKKYARFLGHVLKRLPSRRWAITHHVNAITLLEDEDSLPDEAFLPLSSYLDQLAKSGRRGRVRFKAPLGALPFSAKLRQAAQDHESKGAIEGPYCHRDSMNKPIKENWTAGDISGFGFAFSLVLLGTILSAYSDHPAFWLLVGTGPLVVSLTLIAFLRHLVSVRRGLEVQGRNTKMAGFTWLNGLYRKENDR